MRICKTLIGLVKEADNDYVVTWGDIDIVSCGLAVASPNGAVVPDRELQINAVINQLGFLRPGKRIQKESTAMRNRRLAAAMSRIVVSTQPYTQTV